MTRRAVRWTLALLGLGIALLACLATLTQGVLGHGLTGQYYTNASWTGAPAFAAVEERISTDVLRTRVAGLPAGDLVSARWHGLIFIERAGPRTFHLRSEDDVWLFLDTELVINGSDPARPEQTAARFLDTGLHEIEVRYVDRQRGRTLDLQWAYASGASTAVEPSLLFPNAPAYWLRDALFRSGYLAPLLWSVLILSLPIAWAVRKCARDLANDSTPRLDRIGLVTTLLMSGMLATAAITWGLPDVRGWAPDELTPGLVIDGVAAGFSDGWHSPYPPLHFYLLAIVVFPFQAMARAGLTDLSLPHTYFVMFLLGRSLSVVLAVATVYLVYLCGRTLHGSRWAGIAGALLVASMPPFIYYAKLTNLDVPVTFWLTFSLLWYIRFVRTHRTQALYGFALTAALAVCTKDQAYGFYILPVAHILWLRWRPTGTGSGYLPWNDLPLLGAFCSSALTFVLVHNLLFNYEGFVTHVETILGPASYPPRYTRSVDGHLLMARDAVGQLGWSMGWPALTICLGGVVLAFRTARNRVGWFLLPAASYYASFISVVMYHFDRFFLGVAVILAVYGGGAVATFTASGRGVLWRRLACALVLGYGLAYGAAVVSVMSNDSRYYVEQWSRLHIERSETIALAGIREYLPRFPHHRTMMLQESWAVTQGQQPDIIVMNVQFACWVRPGSDGAEVTDFYARLNDPGNGLYEQILTHRTTPGWTFLGPDSVFQAACENEYTNLGKINPEIRVFRRIPVPPTRSE